MPVGVVGGVIRVHPVAAAALEILGVTSASCLARIATAVGLAQNLTALLALATDGIQRGHMALHARNIAASVGASDEVIDDIAQQMVAARMINADYASMLVRMTKK
jgi:hydroxymethylglutaryl-CoA reductase